VPYGQKSIAWFAIAAALAIVILIQISNWYAHHRHGVRGKSVHGSGLVTLPRSKIIFTIGILLVLIFSKYFYLASIGSYFTFYLMSKFQLSVQSAQMYLFAFLFSVALGTVVGGPVGDRIGRKYVIWVSILGVAPFTLLLPYADLFWTGVLVVIIGLILSSAFSAILVYSQELIPGRVGMVSGLFFGFAFGMGGIGAAVLGDLADHAGIEFVYRLCSFLPLLGIVAAFLPTPERHKSAM
jgi:FSR family fosmidomycin resistance protein-like MFS transporter